MTLRKICTLLIVSAALPAGASTDLDNLKALAQSEFSLLANDFTAAASYKAVAPAEPLGITGFDVGAELTTTKLQSADAWKKAGANVSVLPLPKLHVHKGLPFNVDIGASLVAVPNSDIKLVGGEVRYAIFSGGIAEPAISIRGAMTRLFGVSQLDLHTQSLELTASKGFLMFTPYAGVGRVWGSVTPNVGSLHKESPTANKGFVGMNANFGLANVAAELDRTGDDNSLSLKVGFRW